MRWPAPRRSAWQRLAHRHAQQASLPWQGALAQLFSRPLMSENTPLLGQTILALDFETSGLNPEQDNIVSIGFVALQAGIIRLASARHMLVQSPVPEQGNAIRLHHILPQMQRQGLPLAEALESVWQALDGQVVLGHGTVVEQAFIERFFRHAGLPAPALIWLDTLNIEKSLPRPWGMEQEPRGYWQLAEVRRRYGLPDYPAHHALVDAVACAELLLVQIDRLFRHTAASATVGDLYLYSQP